VEQRFGAAQECKDFFCVELSNGIGCSICCNGKVVAGSSGAAGELGHTVIESTQSYDRLCYCGKTGCIERSAAFPAIAAEIFSALEHGVYSVLNGYYDRSRPLQAHDIRRAMEAGDQLCTRIVKRAANRIGIAIANSVTLLNPELVVLYGFMLDLGDVFIQEIKNTIQEHVFMLSKNFEIRISPKLETMLPLGAAAEMFTKYLKASEFAWIYKLDQTESGEEADSE
jgi:predicted NBD/HSP70 family sugar kinase